MQPLHDKGWGQVACAHVLVWTALQDAKHAVLDTAQKRLHDFVLLRLRELQLLTRWPLAQPAAEQLDHMHRECEHALWHT